MARFNLVIEVDNDNPWLRTEFSLGCIIERIGADIRKSNPGLQEMFRRTHEVKDVYGNVVGRYDMFP